MFEQSTKTIKQKPLKDASFLSICVYVYICVCIMCLQAGGGRCAKTERSFMWVAVDRK